MVNRRNGTGGFLRDFQEFALKGNVIDLAIAVIIGGAFGKIISSFVDDLVMPLINPLIPGGNWRELTIPPGLNIGSFLGAIVDFLIIAFVLFLVIRSLEKTKRKMARQEALAEPEPEIDPAIQVQEKLVTSLDRLNQNLESQRQLG